MHKLALYVIRLEGSTIVVSHDEYKPGVTISSLHELKCAYQPNMIKAVIGVALTSLFLIFFLWITENKAKKPLVTDVVVGSSPNAHTLGNSDNPTTGNQYSTQRMGGGIAVKLEKPNLPAEWGTIVTNRRFPFPNNHDGFSGFNGYDIIKDPTVLLSIQDSSISRLAEKNIDPGFGAVSDPQAEQYVSDYDDEDSDFGIPGGLSLMDVAYHLFPHTDYPEEINIPIPDEPALIKLTKKPRHPSNAYMITGVVVVEFVIRKNGSITDRKLLSEEPEGYNFADSVLEALNEAHYWPARIKGEKTDTKITFTWTMCSGPDCKGSGTSYSEQLIVREDFPKQKNNVLTQSGYLWK